MEFNLNMNDTVKVKLNPSGIKRLKYKHDLLSNKIKEVNGIGLEKFKLTLDEEGYYSTQLWTLFQDFGDMIVMGFDLPFETNIKIKI